MTDADQPESANQDMAAATAHHDNEITLDNDSGLGSDFGSDTQTINSLLTRYTLLYGRRYHADHVFNGQYWGPNDAVANDQQNFTHFLYNLTLDDQLHLAPIKNPHTILDIGTGTGAWAIEMADLYPSAHVTGMDLSPIQPAYVPSNCVFEIADATTNWPYPAGSFDFVHVRELFGSIRDWDYFFNQAYATTKPGGWFEIQEHSTTPIADDGTCGPDAFFTTWGNTVRAVSQLTGNSFSISSESKERIEKAGFVDVVEKKYKWPMSDWSDDPKLNELGVWNQFRVHNGVEDFMLRLLTTNAGWSYDRAQDFMQQMRRALQDTSVHAYLEVYIVYGRKPADTSSL